MKNFWLWLLALVGCNSMGTFVMHQDSPRLFTFRQPQNAAEWQAVKDAGVTDIVKLNAPDEGPAGFSDDYAVSLGMNVHYLTIEPRGDGPLLSQVEGVFEEPDPAVVDKADAIVCDMTRKVGIHCTWGEDRTGYERARERVLCEAWDPDKAHEEWHVRALYIPHGDRVPSPGLEESWRKFVDGWKKARTRGQ
jgi:hypothetical protein